MGEKKSVCQLMLLLLLVFAPQESLVRTVAGRTRLCESQSHLFSGPCWRDTNCGQVCKNEGFYGGKCRGFRKRCFCTKPCAPPHD